MTIDESIKTELYPKLVKLFESGKEEEDIVRLLGKFADKVGKATKKSCMLSYTSNIFNSKKIIKQEILNTVVSDINIV